METTILHIETDQHLHQEVSCSQHSYCSSSYQYPYEVRGVIAQVLRLYQVN